MLYFDTNTITALSNNAGESGLNNWPLKYNPDANGNNKLLELGIDISTAWSYADLISQISAISELSADVDTDGIYTNVFFDLQIAGQLSQYTRIKLNYICDKNIDTAIWMSWVNKHGGIEYELFKDKIEQETGDVDLLTAENYVSDLQTANKKEYTFSGKSYRSYTVVKTGIQKFVYDCQARVNNIERYNDLRDSSTTNDVFVYSRRFYGKISISDYSSTKAGTVNCLSYNHEQETGDEIRILAGVYEGKYTIYKIDADNFYIIATYSTDADTFFNRIVKKQDWRRAIVSGFNTIETGVNPTFSLSFNLKMPTFGAK